MTDVYQLVVLVERLHADHGVMLEQVVGRLHVVEVQAAALQHVDECRRNGAETDFQTHVQRRFRRQPGTDSPELLASDGLVHPELVAPKLSLAKVSKRKTFIPSSSIFFALSSTFF